MTDTTIIYARLQQAEQDAARWRQLSGATDLAAALRKEYERATAAQAKADAAADKDAAAARFAGFGSIGVKQGEGGKEGSGLLGLPFTITWMALEYDMYSKMSLPREHSAAGFETLPQPVLAYLIERHPLQIPASILDLAPGDPEAAFERYFIGKRRGYFVGAAA